VVPDAPDLLKPASASEKSSNVHDVKPFHFNNRPQLAKNTLKILPANFAYHFAVPAHTQTMIVPPDYSVIANSTPWEGKIK
jgi:hypothetical protein